MNQQNHKSPRGWGLFPVLLVLLAAVLLWGFRTDGSVQAPTPPSQGRLESVGQPSTTLGTEPALFPLELDAGLVITDGGNYSGAFMEDGSNEIVSGVFMLQLENQSDRDLQYGELVLTDGNDVYCFQVTNLPAHRQAVLLEQSRNASPDAFPQNVSVHNLAWFTDPMCVHNERISVSGAKGVVNVKNISDQDIDGDIYVYYKYAADSLFFGGITFRVRVEGGLKAGEIRQVPSGHYDPESCTVLDVTFYGE